MAQVGMYLAAALIAPAVIFAFSDGGAGGAVGWLGAAALAVCAYGAGKGLAAAPAAALAIYFLGLGMQWRWLEIRTIGSVLWAIVVSLIIAGGFTGSIKGCLAWRRLA